MLFRRTFYLISTIVVVAGAGWLLPTAHWPGHLWVPALLVAVFLVGPLMIALDIRDGRKARDESAPETSGR